MADPRPGTLAPVVERAECLTGCTGARMRAGNAGSTGPVIRCRHGRAACWKCSVKTVCFVARQTTICSFFPGNRIARLPGRSSSSRGPDGLAKACGDVIRGLPACCGLSRGGNGKSGVCGSMLPVHPVLMASAAAGLPVEVPLQPALPVVQHGWRYPGWPASPVLPGRPGVRQVWFALDGPAGPVLSSSSARCGRAVLFPVWCLPRRDCSARIHCAEGRGLGPPCARIAGWRCHGHDARMFACVDG